MKNSDSQPREYTKSRGGNILPALCSFLGSMIILTVITLCLLSAFPNLLESALSFSPLIGRITAMLAGTIGKIYMFLFTICGALFFALAAALRNNRRIREFAEAANACTEQERDARILANGLGDPHSSWLIDQLIKDRENRKSRRRFLRFVLMCLMLSVFIVSVGAVSYIRRQYHDAEIRYEQAAASYTMAAQKTDLKLPNPPQEKEEEIVCLPELAPITVDFEALREVNPDVVGWIYCPDTVINYPVLHGGNNDVYLHTNYDGTYNAAGSIFVEEKNRIGFQDFNSILYGHHMANGSMFATLEYWQQQAYFDVHPSMWLLTPDQDYKITLYSAYTISAYGDVYVVFPEDGEDAREWVADAKERSAVVPSAVPVLEGKHIMLSTCAYVFDNARAVVHGLMQPISSAGGNPLTETEEN